MFHRAGVRLFGLYVKVLLDGWLLHKDWYAHGFGFIRVQRSLGLLYYFDFIIWSHLVLEVVNIWFLSGSYNTNIFGYLITILVFWKRLYDNCITAISGWWMAWLERVFVYWRSPWYSLLWLPSLILSLSPGLPLWKLCLVYLHALFEHILVCQRCGHCLTVLHRCHLPYLLSFFCLDPSAHVLNRVTIYVNFWLLCWVITGPLLWFNIAFHYFLWCYLMIFRDLRNSMTPVIIPLWWIVHAFTSNLMWVIIKEFRDTVPGWVADSRLTQVGCPWVSWIFRLVGLMAFVSFWELIARCEITLLFSNHFADNLILTSFIWLWLGIRCTFENFWFAQISYIKWRNFTPNPNSWTLTEWLRWVYIPIMSHTLLIIFMHMSWCVGHAKFLW